MQELLDSVGSLSSKERKALAALLKRQGVNLYGVTPISPREKGERLTLSYAQQRQWFLWQLEPDSAAYHISLALRLKGQLDLQALQRSFAALIHRHESLRTTFREEGESVVQVIHGDLPIELALETLDSTDPQALSRRLDDGIQRPFDLENGPLLRVRLLRLAADEHVMVLTLHHIVTDGWSMPIMVEELVQCYEGYRAGHEVSLPALPIQYADYALWQRNWMEAGERERQLTYWTEQLGGEQPVLELPIDRPRPALQRHEGDSLDLTLDAGLSHALKQLAQERGVTLFMLLLASFQALLHRYSGQDDIRVGVPTANRNRVETERLIGFFVNTQVLKADFVPSLTFDDLLQQTKQRVLGGQAHQDLPFEQLVEALQPERSLSHGPLFQVMFNHQREARRGTWQLDGLSLEGMDRDLLITHFDLTLNTFETEHGLQASLVYDTALFERGTSQRLLEHWLNLLAGIVRQPQKAVAELPMLGEAERQTILGIFTQRWSREAAGRPVQRLFEEQVSRDPGAIAVVCEGHSLTYGQLDQQANRLAHRLRELGVGPEVRVAIALPRSVETLVAFLAVLKAGGAYVPLDVAYPPERLLYLMEDCAAALVLTRSDVQAGLPIPSGLPVLALDRADAWQHLPATAPAVVLAEGNLAYVIYTSGSTGQPKGVAVAHGPLAMHCLAIGERYEMSPGDCELQFMSLAFDGAHERWLTTLIHGARLLLRGDELWTPEQTYRVMQQQGVTVTALPPVYLQQLAEHAEREGNPPAVRIYCFGGDAVPQASYDLAWRALRPQYIFNGYGPTETVVTPLLWKARREDACGAAYAPIGTLVGGRSGYVLDAGLNLLPVGMAGELYLGGQGVARGYLERPGLTAERFVPDPFGELGARLYRSGDLTRARPNGLVDYLGRIDHQVKIRGFRIELGEIEAALQAHADIREAVVVDMDGPIGKQLVGFLIATAGQAEQQEALRTELREQLKASLPDYMVPAHLLFLDHLPLTPNGKLDRKALPQPDASQSQQSYAAPRTEREQLVAAIWAEVLKVERVGLTDHFFELGGHSLLATQVISRVRQALAIELPLRELFEAPTLSAFVQRIDGAVGNGAPAFATADRAQPLVLSYAQQRQWFLWQLEPTSA
ncbi:MULTISPECIES: amino acid adenylation domain-containing protein, partial [unclassified Pseudomonas]|uniref:amino acid adenylation domain-containing protein n=1 Tax=unclassified Pseudomonas TaxID=196821 RepID=UPI002446DA8D